MRSTLAALAAALTLTLLPAAAQAPAPAPQPRDAAYTAQIHKFTTEPYFTCDLVSSLPASATVPTPLQVLGYIAGAEGHLTYSKDIYRYFRALAAASPRVRLFTIGRTEEGREIVMAAISSRGNLARLEEYKKINGELADPRRLGVDPTQAEWHAPMPAAAQQAIAADVPFYWITGSIHSPETGSPEMLMELAYRLAVDDSAMYQRIRKTWIVLITPTTEVDGHDRMVDVYNWHRAHPNSPEPPLVYWGHYVAHDNNRDAMGLSLKLTQAVMRTFLEYHPLVLHDLHESEPYLYDNTVGTEPYNAWLDPITTQEWHEIAWYNVEEMTRRGFPGVYTYGTFTTWDPSYLYFIANDHNAIGRLYETFGNGGADTRMRYLGPNDTSRTWWRTNPPLAKTLWSERDNTNYQESALLISLDYMARHREQYVRNFFLVSERALAKARNEGPAAYVLPGDDPRPALQAQLLNLLEAQGIEVSRATAALRVAAPGAKGAAAARTFPAGSYVIRMDQPYSRMADMLLDRQYYSPRDPRPYDDSGWSQGPLRNVETARVTDTAILAEPMEKVSGPVTAPGGASGTGAVYAVDNNAEPALAALLYRLGGVTVEAAEAPFRAAGRDFAAGTLLVPAAARARLDAAARALGVKALGLAAAPAVPRHALERPRIALLHTWLATQDAGWYRLALDQLQIPYDYVDDHFIRDHDDLRARYDVILFPPVGAAPAAILQGIPSWNPPLPWETTPLTPNLGHIASTADMRGGMGYAGLEHLRHFVAAGGELITVMDTARLAVEYGLTHGVSLAPAGGLRARGVVVETQFLDTHSPVAYGYGKQLATYFNNGPVFAVRYSERGGFGGGHEPRASGRGDTGDGPQSADVVQGRPLVPTPELPQAKPWQAPYLSPELAETHSPYLIPEALRPRVILRFADAKDLLYSGQLADGEALAGHPAVIDVPVGDGHILLFANNPVWRGETQGSYALLLNALVNWRHLGLARALPPA
ncbi:MAG TPA: M14 family zinc carboxypeptidase [Terriglobales bacterium]|nr:M14 family zinc carboxypeptidase [Terriglobales bacterium]